MTKQHVRRYVSCQFYASDSGQAKMLDQIVGMSPTTFVLASDHERTVCELAKALELAEQVVSDSAMVYSEGDHGDRIYVRDYIRQALAKVKGQGVR